MVLAQLARDVQATTRRRKSRRDLARLSHCLLDWVAVALAGSRTPLGKMVRALAGGESDSPEAPLLLAGGPLGEAVFAGAVCGHALDFDDTHLGYWGHPGATVIPVALVLAQARPCDGLSLLSAIGAGMEASARIGLMAGESHRAAGWHATATAGIFGAAATAAMLLRLPTERWPHAFALCAVQAGGLAAAFGTDAKPIQVGRAAQLGLEACRLAAAGAHGPLDVIDRAGGLADLQAFAQRTLPRLSEPVVRGVMFKSVAACFGVQAAGLAARALAARLGDASPVAIQVDIPEAFVSICTVERPATITQARFSVALIVALALSGRDLEGAEAIDEAALACPVVCGLAARVRVAGRPDLPPSAAAVSLEFGDGRAPVSLAVDLAVAGPRTLGSERQRLSEKFQRLCEGVLGPARCRTLRDAILAIERCADASALTSLLRS